MSLFTYYVGLICTPKTAILTHAATECHIEVNILHRNSEPII